MTEIEKKAAANVDEFYSHLSEDQKSSYKTGFYDGAIWELASLRSELAEKEKKIEVLLKYESERDLFIFDQQHKIEELQKLCEAADKVIEQIGSEPSISGSTPFPRKGDKKLYEALEVYDQLKNTKP